MTTIHTSETLVYFYETTHPHIPEGCHLHTHCHENLKSHNTMCICCSERERRVYHLTTSSEFKITWAEIIKSGREIIKDKVPFNGVVWYPGGSMKKSRLLHNICIILFHLLPAYLIDTLIYLSGNKPM
jgi:hypothetical protein